MKPAPCDVYKIQFVAINMAAGGSKAQAIAAVTGGEIIVLDYVLNVAAASVITIKSATTSLIGTGLNVPDTTTIAPGFNPYGHFKTAAGAALNLATTVDVAVSGHITYVVAIRST